MENEEEKKEQPNRTITRQDMDRMIFDVVLGELYENADVNALPYDGILEKYKIALPNKEKERLWEILAGSVWVNPMIGFGQAGKLELTTQGFQMMEQFGSYSNFLATTQPPSQQAMGEDSDNNPPTEENPPADPNQKKDN
jgi:hypothetical protein